MRRRFGVRWALFLLVIAEAVAVAPARAAERPMATLLVLDLASTGVEASLAKNLSEILTISLRKVLPGVTVMAQGDVNTLLLVERQRDMMGCQSDVACLAELSGALGADHLVAGSIGRVGSTYLLTLKLVDTRAARTVRAVSEEIGGNADSLIEATRQWGVFLVDPTKVAGFGYVEIGGMGQVTLDGAAIGSAPIQKRAITAGQHTVSWRGESVASTTVEVLAYTVARAEPPALTAAVGELRVQTTPPGARLFIDERASGVSPGAFPGLGVGRHVVRAELLGHEPQELSVDIDPGKSRTIELALATEGRYSRLYVSASYFLPMTSMYSESKVARTDVSPRTNLHLAVKSGSGYDFTLGWVFGGTHAVTAIASTGSVTVKDDNTPQYVFDTTLRKFGIGYRYLFRRGQVVRPTVGALMGLDWFIADSSQPLEPRDPGRFFFDPEVGLLVETPYHVGLHAFLRLDVAGFFASIPFSTVGLGAVAHF